ncbi:MAG: helix-turn-helix domain-containing protein [Alphaproteobacteria bacterium]|nr:helix-turn-helix domain-containing protein [Alphaproteobacteria bacterium]
MAYNTLAWALAQRGLKPGTKLVLIHLANCRNHATGQCNPSQKTLAELCEMTVSSINNHLRILVERGLIKRVRQFDKRTGAARSTQYLFPEATADGPKATSSRGRKQIPPESSAPSSLLEGPSPIRCTPPLKRLGDKTGREPGKEHG